MFLSPRKYFGRVFYQEWHILSTATQRGKLKTNRVTLPWSYTQRIPHMHESPTPHWPYFSMLSILYQKCSFWLNPNGKWNEYHEKKLIQDGGHSRVQLPGITAVPDTKYQTQLRSFLFQSISIFNFLSESHRVTWFDLDVMQVSSVSHGVSMFMSQSSFYYLGATYWSVQPSSLHSNGKRVSLFLPLSP